MLTLKDIVKIYKVGDQQISAVDGINVNFRENEFVSILGPSGCGKTTTLNIIGGLDHYTNGDLIIDGKSTKLFKDRDWDTYRNHKIGFVFQNYNLIPHLSVIKNVEIALSISSTKAKERKERAIKVLTQVGLKDQMYKMPNQLSGGQMQRVAIARALANDPEIILADEPTGALDTKTSIQIMKLLKSISKKKLIVMVTHNQDIAYKYSTRIIKMLDGKIVGDTNEYTSKEQTQDFEEKIKKEQKALLKAQKLAEKQKAKEQKLALKKEKLLANQKTKKSSMSFFSALGLSLKNLLTKKGRTFLTSFAGSIGIIGIALVLAISNGFTGYIANMQSSTLSGYPVSVSAATIDYSKFSSFEIDEDEEGGNDSYVTVYESSLQKYVKYGHYNFLGTDFLNRVKEFERSEKEKNGTENISLIQYNYFTPLKILVRRADGTINVTQNSNSLSIISGSGKGIFYEALSSSELIDREYKEIYKSADYSSEDIYGLTLVIEKGNKMSKALLESLGVAVTQKTGSTDYENISFDEIVSKQFKLIYNNDYYKYDSENDKFTILDSTNQTELESLYSSASDTLKITRILVQKEDSKIELLSSGVMYSSKLAEMYRENCKQSEIAQKQTALKLSQQDSPTGYTFYTPFVIQIAEFSSMLPPNGFTSTAEINYYLKNIFNFNVSTEEAYQLAMQEIGISEIPQSIVFYPNNFDGKTSVTEMIDLYNQDSDEAHQIVYTDNSNALLSTLSSLINIISYVLIAFAGVSLVVSSIMIGIITYVSVIERTKEIGILRSIGARKIDVSRVFNAETLIIGFVAGVLGIGISYLLTLPINLIVSGLTNGINNIAVLNPLHALMLIAISMILTFISGLIPATIASKKDPVECLRTE